MSRGIAAGAARGAKVVPAFTGPARVMALRRAATAAVLCALTLATLSAGAAASLLVAGASKPSLSAPSISTPSLTIPSISTPVLTTPTIGVPAVTVPAVTVTVPPVTLPPVTESPVTVPTSPVAPPETSTPTVPLSSPTEHGSSSSKPTPAPSSSSAHSASATPVGASKEVGDASGVQQKSAGEHTAASPKRRGGGAAGALRAGAQPLKAGVAADAPRTLSRARTRPAVTARGGSARRGTIERLIDVVPEAVWIAIGALALLALALTGGSWLAIGRARRSERQRRRLAADAGLLQAALLPVVPERLGSVRTSVAYRPADGPGAGGDFYDLFELKDGRLAAIVGDVSGHGREALPQTALIRYTLRAYLDAGMSPRRALAAAAAVLDRQLQGSFATAVLAVYDARARTLTYACAGHPAPLVMGDASVEPVIECCSPPIGIGSTTGLRETTVRVPGGARACFFTDGLVEARIDGELFGTERLTAALGELGPAATAEALLARVTARTDRRPDDMAACVLCFEGADGGPLLCGEELEMTADQLDWHGTARLLAAYGVEHTRVAEALAQVRLTVERVGAAILFLRLDGATVEVAVSSPHAATVFDATASR